MFRHLNKVEHNMNRIRNFFRNIRLDIHNRNQKESQNTSQHFDRESNRMESALLNK